VVECSSYDGNVRSGKSEVCDIDNEWCSGVKFWKDSEVQRQVSKCKQVKTSNKDKWCAIPLQNVGVSGYP
jgi:hypothetical protein